MNKKLIVFTLAVIIILTLAAVSAKPKGNVDQSDTAPQNKPKGDTSNMSVAAVPAEKVEVFLFHRTQRCATCIAIGKLSGQTVEERFSEEIKNGKIVFREVNIDEPQNKELAEKFQAGGSSLFINAIREGSDNIEEDLEVWRLTGDEAVFKNYLARKINGLIGKQ